MKGLVRVLWCLLIVACCVVSSPAKEESSPAALQQFGAAVALQNKQMFDLAAEEWRVFLRQHETDPLVAEATHYLGVCLFQEEQYKDAVAAFDRALAEKPDTKLLPKVQLNLGLAHYNLGLAGKRSSFKEAASVLGAVIEERPSSTEAAQAALYLAESLIELDRKDDAIKVYLGCLNTKQHGGQQRERLLYGLGVAYQETNSPRKAKKYLKQFVQQFPQSGLAREANIRLADSLIDENKYSQAFELLAGLATDESDELADYICSQRAACLFEQKKFPAAAEAYSTVVQRFPDSELRHSATLAAGKSFYSAGNLPQARTWLTKSVGQGSEQTAEALHWLTQCLLKQDDAPGAVKVLGAVRRSSSLEWTDQLQLDLADAMYEIPDRRSEAADIYAKLATNDSTDRELVPYASYMSSFARLEGKEYRLAKTQAERFLDRFQDHELKTDVLAIMAECLYQSRDYEAAEKQWKQLCRQFPDRPESSAWIVRRAFCLERLDRPEEVLAWLRPRIRELPDGVLGEAGCLIANAHLKLGQPKEAAIVLRPLASETNGQHTEQAMLLLARAEQALGNAGQAAAAYAKLSEKSPDSKLAVDAQLQLAELHYANEQFADAGEAYRRIAEHSNDAGQKAAAQLGLGWCQLNQDKLTDATTTLQDVIADFSSLKEALKARYALGVSFQRQNKHQQAIEQLSTFLDESEESAQRADAFFVLGICQSALKKHDRAIRSFRKSLKANSEYAERDKVLYELAWAYDAIGEKTPASKYFHQLATDFPNSPLAAEAHYRVAEVAYDADDYDQARTSYRVALANAEQQPEILARAHHKIAWTWYHEDDFAKAESAFRRQLSQASDDELAAVAQWMVGECLFQQGEHETALVAFRQAFSANKCDPKIRSLGLLHAGQAAAKLKRWKESLQLHQQCMQDESDSSHGDEARYGQAWALQNLNQTEKAQLLYERVADESTAVVGARARFMLGELQFAERKYEDAIRTFFKVAYGYGHPKAPKRYRPWQADSLFEAARCCESSKRIKAAARLYQELVDQYPDSDKFDHSKKKIASLGQ